MTPVKCPIKANYHLLLNWEPKTHVHENNSRFILVWDDILYRSDQVNVIMYMVTVLPEFQFIKKQQQYCFEEEKDIQLLLIKMIVV